MTKIINLWLFIKLSTCHIIIRYIVHWVYNFTVYLCAMSNQMNNINITTKNEKQKINIILEGTYNNKIIHNL